jgi:hypothetical protein
MNGQHDIGQGFLNSCARTETNGMEGSLQTDCVVFFRGEIVIEFILRGFIEISKVSASISSFVTDLWAIVT